MSRLEQLINPPKEKHLLCLLSYASLSHFTYTNSGNMDARCPVPTCEECLFYTDSNNIKETLDAPNSNNGS